MTSILEELFYGNVCPGTDFRSKDTKTRKLMAHLANHHETLSGTLTDKQKELLEKFDDCYGELTDSANVRSLNYITAQNFCQGICFFLSAASFLYRQKSTGISTFSNAFLSFI